MATPKKRKIRKQERQFKKIGGEKGKSKKRKRSKLKSRSTDLLPGMGNMIKDVIKKRKAQTPIAKAKRTAAAAKASSKLRKKKK